MNLAIGIDIGVTNVKSVCVTDTGDVRHRDSIPTDAHRPDWPERVRLHLLQFQEQVGPANWVGLASPGLARPDGACIAWMQGRLGEVEGLEWGKFLRRPAPIINDAQAALLGEVWQGAARGARNAMLLTLGTGVGGALMVDGRLLRGHIGRVGHLGHISLDPGAPGDIANTPGSLEDAIGNHNIERRSGGRFNTTHDLVAAHRAGDADATRIWLTSVQALAAGIASLINVADPEVVIVGGGIAVAGPALFDPLLKFLDQYEWRPHGRRVRLAAAALGEHAGALGAAYNAILQASEK